MNNRTKPLILCIDDDEVTLKLLDRLITKTQAGM